MDAQKAYRSLNAYLKDRFGEKVMKISLDGGFSCPNRDGTINRQGCLFCSERGSGDFAGNRLLSLTDQFCQVQKVMEQKWPKGKYIAYFQAFTNTYDTVAGLKQRYDEAVAPPGVVGLAIATRPDCLDEEKVRLIASYAKNRMVWVELGLQTAKAETAQLINRGYDNEIFEAAMALLKKYDLDRVVHLIFGLPGEDKADMLHSVDYVNSLGAQGVKFHLLHLMKGTPMVKLYEEGKLTFLSQEEYVDIICQAIGRLDPEVIIHRLTGDAPKDLLIGPQWSLQKWQVLNDIDRELMERNISQGSLRK